MDKVSINKPLYEAVVRYLAGRPYNEVAAILHELSKPLIEMQKVQEEEPNASPEGSVSVS